MIVDSSALDAQKNAIFEFGALIFINGDGALHTPTRHLDLQTDALKNFQSRGSQKERNLEWIIAFLAI